MSAFGGKADITFCGNTLSQADVGIAIGAGTDVAIEAADIILIKSNPNDVAAIIGLARATYGKMIQNLIWATGYNNVAFRRRPASWPSGASFSVQL